MKTKSLLWTSLFILSVATACDAPSASDEDFGAGDVTQRCTGCGLKLNTSMLGTFEFSELDTTGAWWNGVKLNSVTSQELGVVDQVFVKSGALYARKSGKTWPDKYLLNSIWKVTIDEGNNQFTQVSMQLKGIGYDNGNRIYTFTNNAPGEEWGKEGGYNCDDDPSEPGDQFGAILSADIVIDPDRAVVKDEPNKIFFGCLSGGVGKAAKWGYPSYKHTNIEFETAIRVVRADYCGNGFSFTKPGMALQLTDIFGVSSFGNQGSKDEAFWDDSGAFCVGEPRFSAQWGDASNIQHECELMGAVPPKKCEEGMALDNVPNGMYWSKLP